MFRFLLVSLNMDAILQGTTIGRRRRRLAAITNGLGLEGAYSETRIKGQGEEEARLGIATLMWISHWERPLNVNELCQALGVEIGSPDLDRDDIPSIGTLLVCCQGLVTVDKESSTVRLIHFTLQEHLRAHPQLFGRAHSTIAETCLTYLNSDQVKAISASPSHDLWGTPLPEVPSLNRRGSYPHLEGSDLEDYILEDSDLGGSDSDGKIFSSIRAYPFCNILPSIGECTQNEIFQSVQDCSR